MTPLRFITAASLFDGHDVSINIIRRLLQSKGVEVIHLGHNRSAGDVVKAAIEEDVQAVALSSYQGGHNEYFKYVRQLLDEAGAQHVKIFGGGGGVITAKEISDLEAAGTEKIYGPQDGVALGLEGIIDDMIKRTPPLNLKTIPEEKSKTKHFDRIKLARVISFIEANGALPFEVKSKTVPVLGITGTGGAGKSSLIDELLKRFSHYCPHLKIALISVDPTKKKTNGALLGDRIRLGNADAEQFYVRSLATRGSGTALSPHIDKVLSYLKSLDFGLIIVESSGIGQASDEIASISDKCAYVMTSEYGASTQLEKIEMLEVADFVVLNKFERPRAEDALRDIRKQYRRNHKLFANIKEEIKDEHLPVFGTIASQFNDPGVNALFSEIIKSLLPQETQKIEGIKCNKVSKKNGRIIDPARVTYLREVAGKCREYNQKTKDVVSKLRQYEVLEEAEVLCQAVEIKNKKDEYKKGIDTQVFAEINNFDQVVSNYLSGSYQYQTKNKKIDLETKYTSLSGTKISKVAVPKIHRLSDKYEFIRNQNIPGFFPFAAGIFPFKRKDEDPKRMFAGEGGPGRTNKRFHYLCRGESFKRLSTAFDSVTLYGQDPDVRPDIYGKIGESGVSISTLDDMEDLYKGFQLTDPNTSVSMTINGPAPIILAMFMNTAAKQRLDEKSFCDMQKCLEVMRTVRGTVQADILKEDQAQNTCIFSLDFALRLMGDVQDYFSRNKINNYYTVSISGYHIAEAGANPITQLAFTLANGFTYVESYLSRGIKIDDFCENLSFFFSNGLDPEYSVMGHVARKIWAVAMREKYGANIKSQKLKYHIQTSGRSLHAQEIDFNDIRTTLQAFLALSDNCNSLHTNAYDEAVTTPTEQSVRRAMAIQLIINKEFGPNFTDNPLQGSFLFEELATLVEEQVLEEFDRISDKGGVLGAMESMYQRGKIQDESLFYERLKDHGDLPIIGVNTFLPESSQEVTEEIKLTRASAEEKNEQIKRNLAFRERNKNHAENALQRLKQVALSEGNIFEELLNTVRFCSLGQITETLYEVGGKYRRNI